MEIDIEEIRNGNMNGKEVWICDYRYNDYSKKPIRNIEPTLVMVRDNSETEKRIYYSSSHFVKLNKNFEPIKSGVIALFDNTGFRSRTGTALNVFTKYDECYNRYHKQKLVAERGLKNYAESILNKLK